MDRSTLNRLLDEVVGEGGGLAVNPPSSATRRSRSLPPVWFARLKRSSGGIFPCRCCQSPYPWTQAERADLLRCNVDLQPLEARLAHAARTWLRPIMAAGKRVVFVLHNSDEEHHPLWDQVKSCAKELPEIDVEEAIQSGRKLSGFPVKGSCLEFKPLPTVKRWWRLSDGSLLDRAQERILLQPGGFH